MMMYTSHSTGLSNTFMKAELEARYAYFKRLREIKRILVPIVFAIYHHSLPAIAVIISSLLFIR